MNSSISSTLRVFVVERNADTLKYLVMYLEDLGHIVFRAASVASALLEIPKSLCDVLISDTSLKDGWSLLRRLREENLSCPKYAISTGGSGRNHGRFKSEAAGFRHHLAKPFELEELDAMLEEAAREKAA